MHDGDGAVAPRRDVNELLHRVPPEGIHSVAVPDRRHDLPRGCVHHYRRFTASGEDPVGGAIVGDARRALARRERPRRQHFHRLDVEHLHRARAFVVHEDLPFAIARRAFRPVVLELGRADDVAGLGIEGHGGADGPAVIRQDDTVGKVLVHDAVEATGGDRNLLDHRQGLEIEHRHRRIAAVGDEPAPRLGRQGDAVRARRVGNVAHHLAAGAVQHHHVGAARHEYARGAGLGGQVIGAAVPADRELGDLERLRGALTGPGQGGNQEQRGNDYRPFCHPILGGGCGLPPLIYARSSRSSNVSAAVTF